MDHVPQVTDPVFPPIKVPCLSQSPYKHEAGWFEGYPAQRGWDINLLKRGIFTQHSYETTATFLQDWLFFGVLQEVLGQDGTKRNFVVEDELSKQAFVTTKHLVPTLTTLFWQIKDKDKDQAIATLDRMEGVLVTLSLLCNVARAPDDPNLPLKQFQWPLIPEIDLSIRALGQLLATGVSATGMFIKTSAALCLTFPGGGFTSSRMRQAGWCPSDIAMVSEYMSASSLYYASSLRRWQLHNDHSQCCQQFCRSGQIDTSTYQTVHCGESCTCEHVEVSTSHLTSIISGKGIPLVTITIAASGDPVLELSPFHKGQHYVAFSHVWSDGMGNLHRNSLPKCQILRLKALIDELSWTKGRTWDTLNKAHIGKLWRRIRGRTIPFWLDTFCVPVGDEHKPYRKLAISLMYKTYVSAQDVLVLDSEIQNTPIPSDKTEIFLRVSISGWMRRLWTLQESVLGRRLQVKFRNGIVDLVTEYNSDTDQSWNNGLGFENYAGSPHSDSRSFYWKDRSLRFLIVENRERKFIGTFNTYTSLHSDPVKDQIRKQCFAILDAFVSSNYRSSLRKADEYLCLSGLLGWDTACLDGVSIEDRMKALLRERTVLPQGLLFIAGPRLHEKGWRWALRDFGNNGSVQLKAHLARRDGTPARLCSKGLIVEYPGFVIQISKRPQTLDDFFIEVPLFQDYHPVICRIRRHSGHVEAKPADSSFTADTEASTSTSPPLGIFFHNPTSVVAANVPMGAIIVEMDKDQDSEETSVVLEGALPCSYLHLAQMEMLGYKEVIGAVYPEAIIQADVYSVPREGFGVKRWCVG